MEGKWFYRNSNCCCSPAIMEGQLQSEFTSIVFTLQKGVSPLPCPPLAPGTKPWAITRAICRGVPKFSKSRVGLFNIIQVPSRMYVFQIFKPWSKLYLLYSYSFGLIWSVHSGAERVKICLLVRRGQ